MDLNILGGTLVTPYETIPDGNLVIRKGKIVAFGVTAMGAENVPQLDAQGLWVIPGLIDIHVHGALGRETIDGTAESLWTIGRFLATHGVTSYLPTTTSAPAGEILRAVRCVADTPQPPDGAQHLGVHLEGPYLNPKFAGAQRVNYIRKADASEFKQWLESGVVRLMTIAPEMPGALSVIENGVQAGVEFAAGHSGATYEEFRKAVDLGLRQGSHSFNGMAPLHHRNPGLLGGILTDSRVWAQIICDGVHVHPVVVSLLYRLKGPERTIVVSDSIAATGLQSTCYERLGRVTEVRDGVARTPEGRLAGSTHALDTALRNLMSFCDIPIEKALIPLTASPAEALGLKGCKGVLATGADADIVLLDEVLTVRTTIIGGRVVYTANS